MARPCAAAAAAAALLVAALAQMDGTDFDPSAYSFNYDYDYFFSGGDYYAGADFGQASCTELGVLNPNVTRPCDLRVTGGDAATEGKLESGLDGLYAVMGCKGGRPYYKRVSVPAGTPDRFIMFSVVWGDWDFSSSEELSDESTLGYGGEGDGEDTPEYILSYDWYVLSTLAAHPDDADNETSTDFTAADITVQCNFNCTDGVQNGDETGVDCGGTECSPCYDEDSEMEKAYQEALLRLQNKVIKEQSEYLTPFQQSMIALLIVASTAIVCGGPFMYLLKQQRLQQQGYTQMDPTGSSSRPGARQRRTGA